jgi:hypothetical protein
VNYSPAFRWLVVMLLPITLLLKIPVGAEDSGEFATRIANFLTERGFKTVTFEELLSTPVVRANSGECRMFVVNMLSKRWTRELISKVSGTDDRIFTVFRGAVYEQAPTLQIAINNQYFKILRQLRLSRAQLVIGVSASSICHADELPWNEA